MQEIIHRIATHATLSTEEATKALTTVSQFVKEKYPMLAGTVDSVLGKQERHRKELEA